MTEPISHNPPGSPSPPDAAGWIGQHIGNYRLIRVLGEGGMGIVFEAVHDGVGGRAAVKILRPQVSFKPELVARFFNERRKQKPSRKIVNIEGPGMSWENKL